jgi:hypothetical protein
MAQQVTEQRAHPRRRLAAAWRGAVVAEQQAACAAAPVLQLHGIEERRRLDELPQLPQQRRVRADRAHCDLGGEQHS